MNELQLSNDLPVIESELKVFKEMNGYSMYEIGRRLKHVKENDLVHGEWIEWLEKVDIHPREAQRFIKIVSDPQLKTTTWSHLGSRTLYEITGVPVEEREKKHLTEKGEEKTVDEMTVKEIQDLKRQLKQRDEQNAQLQSQVEQAQRSESIARKQLEDEQNREPEVIERYMEPEDYQETKNALAQSRQQQKLIEQRNEKLEKDIKEMELRRDEVSEKSQKYDELNKAINDMNAKLNDGQQRLKAQKEIYDLVKGSEKVIREVAPLCYLAFSKDIIDNDYARKPIEKIIEDLTDMANRLRKQLKKGEVIDV